jgi:hypothetical protein
MTKYIVPFLLVSIVSASILSERYLIIYYLERKIDATPVELLEYLRNNMESSEITENEVREIRDSIVAPISVPSWFHQTLARIGTYNRRTVLREVAAQRPHDCPELFKSRSSVAQVAEVWFRHCIYPLPLFPDTPACRENADGSWALAEHQVMNYLWLVMMEEHEEIKETQRLNRKRKIASTEPREIILRKLIENSDSSDVEIHQFVHESVPESGISLTEVNKIRNEILSVTEIPNWLFFAFEAYKTDCRSENEDLRATVSAVAPKNFRMDRLGEYARVWSQYCFNAPSRSSSDSQACFPISGRYRLSKESIKAYLNSLIQTA